MSYCDCSYADDGPEFYRQERIKAARKQFKCCECYGPIFIGEPYRRLTGKWNGDIGTYRYCHLCDEMRQWAEISMPCFCAYEIGSLHERVREMVQDVAPNLPGFFFEYGRRAVVIRRRKRAAQ